MFRRRSFNINLGMENEIHTLSQLCGMKAESVIRRQWIKRVSRVRALWTLVALSFAHRYYVSSASFGNPVPWRHAISHALADWYLFALLSIPAAWLAKRWPIERANRVRHAAFHRPLARCSPSVGPR